MKSSARLAPVVSNELRKISVTGGPSVLLARANAPPRGASWGDNSIVFATTEASTGLLRIPAGGGEPEVLTKPDTSRGEGDHILTSFVPGGRAVLFAITSGATPDSSQVAVLDLATGKYASIVRGGNHPEYVDSGHLVYAASGS